MSDPESDQPIAQSAPLRFDVFTLFPAMFEGPISESILKRASDRGLIEIGIHDIRTWTTDRHRTADDTPYGGGAGMVMKAPPIIEGVEAILGDDLANTEILLMAASGQRFDQRLALELRESPRIVLICGHYEGIDERVVELLGCREIAVGDAVLTGGELPAMLVIDAVSRLIPGVIDQASTADESFGNGLVEYPHYTRPAEFRGLAVPEILLSGHHANIDRWRREQAMQKTARNRPDLLPRANSSSN
jgi:tRNA (guanine37-N1)-methyltransferase